MATQLWAVALTLTGVMIGSFGPIFLKKGSTKLKPSLSSVLKNKNLFIGILCYAIATIIFIPALKGGELSVLYPLVSLSYVLVSLYSIKFLKEKMNKFKWIGIAIILIGVTFIGLGS